MDARKSLYNTFIGLAEMQQSVLFMDKLYASSISENQIDMDNWSFAVSAAIENVENNFAPGQA